MSKYIPATTIDLTLNQLKTADRQTVCSQLPATYWQAVNAPAWEASKLYSIGDTVKAPTDNNMCYECTVSGTSNTTEPAWSITPDNTFTDNNITWKAHNNYSLAGVTLLNEDKAISNITGGRKLSIAEKQAISYRSGTVAYTALLNSIDKTIEMITTASTTILADDDIVSGRIVIFQAIDVSLVLS